MPQINGTVDPGGCLMSGMIPWLAALLLVSAVQAGPAVDPQVRGVVERFFAAQQAEDVEAYLALWSRSARRPSADQLRFIFDAGDDQFLDVAVVRATVAADTAHVRVRTTRVRTDLRAKRPDGSPRVFSTRLQLALSLVREDGEWKILREGPPADELAAALIDAADPAARAALLQAEPDLLNARLVEAIARRADERAQQSQYRAAQALYERSLEVARAIGDAKSEGQALQNIGNSLYFQRDFPAALASYERRLALEREAANDEGIATALVGIATIFYSTYEYGAALTAYRDALAIQERLNDDGAVATTLTSTGNVLYVQGDYESAIADYRRAETLKRKSYDLGGAANALEGLGRVYSAQGNYSAALAAFTGVLDERRTRHDRPRQAMVLQSIGEIHFRLGNTDAARSAYQESHRLFADLEDLGNAGRALQGAALTELVAGRFAAGEKAYTESIAACTKAADEECIARAQVGLGFALAAQEKFDAAVTWYSRSLGAFQALKMDEAGARARIGMADALMGRADHQKALDRAITARRMAVALGSDDVLWRALVTVARAERKLGRPKDALGSARAAVTAVERMAAAALQRPGQAAPRDGAAAYAALAVLQAAAGDATAAFDTAEAMRAYALRAALASHEREIARGMSAEERAGELRLTTTLRTLVAQHQRQRALPKPDTAQIEKLDAAISAALAARAASQAELFARLPDLRIWRGLHEPASVDDLAAFLDSDGKVLLQFVVDDHDVVVLTASRRSGAEAPTVAAFATPIKRQLLAERVARALAPDALGSVEGWRTASRELFAILPRAVSEQLAAATSIIVIPDDILWRIPFEAMPVGDRYLADRVPVSYMPSVAAAVLAPAPAAQEESRTIVAVAAPLLAADVVEMLKSTAPTWTLRTGESSAAEVVRIGAARDAPAPKVLTGAEATQEALEAAIRSARALHIAAPFRVNSASPLFSPVLLAAADAEGTRAPGGDGELDAREVFNLQSSADVVMISDPAALSMRDAAAELTPIHWAWRATGATTLIVRRWAGQDEHSREFVARFYEHLGRGRPPAVAFDAARTGVRAATHGRPPAAWAGWLLLSGR